MAKMSASPPTLSRAPAKFFQRKNFVGKGATEKNHAQNDFIFFVLANHSSCDECQIKEQNTPTKKDTEISFACPITEVLTYV